MRLFVSINFGTPTRDVLIALQDELRQSSMRGRFTAPENLHLTLAFLGECDQAQMEAAKRAVLDTNAAPFPLEIHRLGRFPRPDGDIWWAGVGESEPLIALQRDLTDRLIATGFVLERRKYTPHITLGRQVITTTQEKTIPPFGEIVSCIHLMQSKRIAGRLVYTSICEKGLLSGDPTLTSS